MSDYLPGYLIELCPVGHKHQNTYLEEAKRLGYKIVYVDKFTNWIVLHVIPETVYRASDVVFKPVQSGTYTFEALR